MGRGRRSRLGREARALRAAHNAIGVGELACLSYLWFCAIRRRRDRWLALAVAVLLGEGAALLVAKECPLGAFQRQAGDDVPMFELWFGPKVAPFAIPTLTVIAAGGLALVLARPRQGLAAPTPQPIAASLRVADTRLSGSSQRAAGRE
ncbi:MAG: hypothetical protein ABSD85_09365 [Acidimicrobiales bacterium]